MICVKTFKVLKQWRLWDTTVTWQCRGVPPAHMQDCPSSRNSQSSSLTVLHPGGCISRWRRTALNKQRWNALRRSSTTIYCIFSSMDTNHCFTRISLGCHQYTEWLRIYSTKRCMCDASILYVIQTWLSLRHSKLEAVVQIMEKPNRLSISGDIRLFVRWSGHLTLILSTYLHIFTFKHMSVGDPYVLYIVH